jgi:hypothetical protein
MTERSPEKLAVVARSWAKAPELIHQGDGFTNQGYDRGQRAYRLSREAAGQGVPLLFKLEAGKESPVFNPAFLIRNWGEAGASLVIDGVPVRRGSDFRLGHRKRIDGTDLIIWIRKESMEPLNFLITDQE